MELSYVSKINRAPITAGANCLGQRWPPSSQRGSLSCLQFQPHGEMVVEMTCAVHYGAGEYSKTHHCQLQKIARLLARHPAKKGGAPSSPPHLAQWKAV
mmetsp:Transcript_46127/g.86124  ORF Transcript_46127/g.86124 Transcript_46127/m.86124 type:complete len:99 (-) Transcript_46127:2987-3283(-)